MKQSPMLSFESTAFAVRPGEDASTNPLPDAIAAMASTGRWLLASLCLAACTRERTRVHTDAPHDVGPAVLAAAGESVFVEVARPRPDSGVLLAGDSATARALIVSARRSGLDVRVAQERVWCGGRTGADRTEGTKVIIALDSITADRAVVHWSSACLLESPPAPFAGGSGGSFELRRRGGTWVVAARLVTFSY